MNTAIFLNCDLLELEIRDSYEKTYYNYVSFASYNYIFKYCSSYSSFVISLHVCFSNQIYGVCMMHAFLNRPFYTWHIKLGK